jgi:hypothetical protein
MATLRNLVIGLIRQAGYTRIAATLRKIRNDPPLLLTILGPRQQPLRAALRRFRGAHGGRKRG